MWGQSLTAVRAAQIPSTQSDGQEDISAVRKMFEEMPTAQQIEKERFHEQMAMLTHRMDDAATEAHIQLSLKARKGKAQ